MPPKEITPAESIKEAESMATYTLPSILTDKLLQSEGVFLIVKQPDGNYIGETKKDGKIISARQGDPQTVLTMLITHE